MPNEINATVRLFLDAGRFIRRRITGSGAPLSPAQFEALRFVHEHDGPFMREVAKYLEIAAPSLTSLVGELVRGGYVKREINPKDRREVRLLITKEGQGALRQTMASRKKVLKSVLLDLSPRDHADLQRIFLKILKNK